MSGRDPDLLNARLAGWVFHARAESEGSSVRRLVAEVWLDVERAAVVPGFSDILAAVDASQPVELSTGFSTQPVEEMGNFQGETYDWVLHPVGADHLVISTEMTGACSVRDGCGLGVNKALGANCGSCAGTCVTRKILTEDGMTTQQEEPKGIKAILGRVVDFFAAQQDPKSVTFEEMLAANLSRELMVLQLEPSDQERMQMCREAMQAQFGGADREIMIADMYSDSKTVIFWISTPMGPMPKGAEYYRTTWTEGADGKMTFAENPTRVRRMTTYEPVDAAAANTDEVLAVERRGLLIEKVEEQVAQVDNHQEEITMAGEEKDTKDVLAAIAKLSENIEAISTKVAALEAGDATVAGLKRAISALTEKVEQVQATAAPAVQERERKRSALVKELAGNHRVPFTLAELEAKPLDELEKIQAMASTENFGGRGGPKGPEQEVRYMEPVPYWLVDKDKK